MVQIESAWPRYPDYEINLRDDGVVARAWFGDLLLAESRNAIRLEETKHVDRLYFPVDDVHWEHFEPSLNFTICPFKGAATYWSLTAVDPVEKDIVWTYTTPLDEVAGIEGYVAFYQERVRLELEEHWPGDAPDRTITSRFPAWGDAADLLALIDVAPAGDDGHFVGAPYRDTTRNVVEGGQMFAAGPRGGVEDAAAPTGHAGLDVLPEGRRVRRAPRRRGRRAARGSHLLHRGGPRRPGREAAQRRALPARRRLAARDRRQRRDARRRGTRRRRAVRHAGDGTRAADRGRRLPPRSRPPRTARAARLDPVPRRARRSRTSTPR